MLGTFLASDIRLLRRVLDRRGIDPARVFESAGINLELSEQPRARYPFDRVVAAWNLAAEISGDVGIGLDAAGCYRPTDFHGLAVVFLASNDLRTALDRLVRYQAVVNTAVTTKVTVDADSIDVTCTPSFIDDARMRVLEDARAAVLVDLCREGADGELNPLSVEFTYPAPADRSAHDNALRAPLVFGATEWRLSFRLADVERPFLASNRELARSNDKVLDETMRGLARDDLRSRVKRAMLDALPSGTPSEASVAKTLSLSTRSLQRRFVQERTSFGELLGSVRRELAERYVHDPDLPITEISYMLGFSDVSSFSRAFRRWTGRSPAATRSKRTPATA